jgi:hypothetical protein
MSVCHVSAKTYIVDDMDHSLPCPDVALQECGCEWQDRKEEARQVTLVTPGLTDAAQALRCQRRLCNCCTLASNLEVTACASETISRGI